MRPARYVVLALLLALVFGASYAPAVASSEDRPSSVDPDLVPKKITVEPPSLNLEVATSVGLVVRAWNETGGEIPVKFVEFTVRPDLGKAVPTNESHWTFTAGTKTIAEKFTVTAWTGKPEKLSIDVSATVTPGPVTTVQVGSAEVSVTVGETTPVAVKGLDIYGNPSKKGTFNWTLGDRTLGVFNRSQGDSVTFIAGTRSGAVLAYVKAAGKEEQIKITVAAGQVAAIRVSPATIDAEPGDIIDLYAYASDKYGNEVPLAQSSKIIWGLNRNFARVANATGPVTRITVSDYTGSFLSGVGRVTAKIGNSTDSAEVTIRPSLTFWAAFILIIVGAAAVFSTLWKQRIICQECGQAHWAHRVQCKMCGTLLAPAEATSAGGEVTPPPGGPGDAMPEEGLSEEGEATQEEESITTEDLLPQREKQKIQEYDPLLDDPGPGQSKGPGNPPS